jgi:hypothetical protein
MSTQDPKEQKVGDWDEDDVDDEEFDDMELLERLETLREDMEDLGVTTLAEVIQRINELHHKLDNE